LCYFQPLQHSSGNGMKKISRHQALSYTYAYIGGGHVDHWKYYDQADLDKHFIVQMLQLANRHLDRMSVYRDCMVMSRSDWLDFITSKTCVLCKRSLDDEASEEIEADEVLDDNCIMPKRLRGKSVAELRNCNVRVRHHYHGESYLSTQDNVLLHEPARYRGAAHLNCNLNLKSRTHLTVVLHNFGMFDSKLILEGCSKAGVKDITILAKSSEKILSLAIEGKIRFIDSNLHLTQSLSVLSDTLKKGGTDKFVCTRQMIPGRLEREYDLLLGKQAFPYEYVTLDNLDIYSTSLPPREAFFSSLKNSTVSEEEYANACKIYKSFDCKSLRDYLKLYNKLDVGILADVFEDHRKTCRIMYQVDPLNFLTLPSLAFNVGMSVSKQTLDYIQDVDLYLEVKRATRGGVVHFSTRYAKANLPTEPDYNPQLPESHLVQLDVNSLYSWAMSRCLPTRNFRKLTAEEVEVFDISTIDENGPKGYLLNVDVKVPRDEALHDFLSDLPPLPEKILISEDDYSSTQRRISNDNPTLKVPLGDEQYLCTLHNKKGYSAFIPTLKQAIDVGLIIEKVNYGYVYEQSPFVRDFSESNVAARANATSDSLKQTLKLILNAFYGRTGINTGAFRDFHIAVDHIRARELIRQSHFKSATVINEGMVLIEMMKKTNLVNNHSIVGAAILDTAKAYFFKVWYAMKRQFGNKIRLQYTDTDSYLVHIETSNLLESLSSIKIDGEELMDFSYLPDTVEFQAYKINNKNKGVMGKLKSETNEHEILEGIVLRKKQYALKLQNRPDKIKNRGQVKSFSSDITFESYKDTLFNGKILKTKLTMLRSIRMQLYNILMERLTLTPICTSRFLLPPLGVETLPFGHYKINSGIYDTVLEDVSEG